MASVSPGIYSVETMEMRCLKLGGYGKGFSLTKIYQSYAVFSLLANSRFI